MATATRRQLWRMVKMLLRKALKTLVLIFKAQPRVNPRSRP